MYLVAGLAAMAGIALTAGKAIARPVEYVRVCDLYGAGYFYVPGTDVCYNAVTGEMRWQTQYGTKRSLNRVDLAFQGTSVAMAMPTPIIEHGKTFAIAGNFGSYDISHALGLAGAFEVSPGLSFHGGISVGTGASQQAIGSKVGFNYSW
jgi:hypothetical protein